MGRITCVEDLICVVMQELMIYRILREPPPPLFAAIHLTMNDLFDMDEIFADLVEQKHTTVWTPIMLYL